MTSTRLASAVALTRTMLAAAEHQDWPAYRRAQHDRGLMFTGDLYTDPDAGEELYELADLQQRLCVVLTALRDQAMARSLSSQHSTTAVRSYFAVCAAGDGLN